MLGWFSNKRKCPDPAASIYAAVVSAARNPVFFTRFGVADTVEGRFEVLSIMLYLMSRRLVHGADPDKDLAKRIAEHFVVDMDSNLRDMGVSDLRVAKKMQTLYGAYGGRVAAYDIAIAAGGNALSDAVERNVFPQGAPDSAAEALAAYIRATNAVLAGIPTAEIGAGQVAFPDPAGFVCQAGAGEMQEP